MSIIAWIIIGGLAGWVGSLILKSQGGFLRNIITGIVGALIGGFIMNFLGFDGLTGFNLWTFVVALIGSIILIAIGNAIFGRSSRATN